MRLTLERILRAMLGIAKSREPKPQFLESREVKVKIIRRLEEKSLFWKVKNYHLVIFVVEKATPKQHAAIRKEQWPLLKKCSQIPSQDKVTRQHKFLYLKRTDKSFSNGKIKGWTWGTLTTFSPRWCTQRYGNEWGQCVQQNLREAGCHIKQIEPLTPKSNAAEGSIRELKPGVGREMVRSGEPKRIWDDCLIREAYVRSSTALDILSLEGQFPDIIVKGHTSDISPLA
jgi:hypothetical protein